MKTNLFFQNVQVNEEFPAYVLFTPTVVDLDSEGGPLEVIVGTSAGNLHVLDHTGSPRAGFPLLLTTLHGQVGLNTSCICCCLSCLCCNLDGFVFCRQLSYNFPCIFMT